MDAWNAIKMYVCMYGMSNGPRVALNHHTIIYAFVYGNVNDDHHLGTGSFVHKGNISAVN
jgi:hypothetical protein